MVSKRLRRALIGAIVCQVSPVTAQSTSLPSSPVPISELVSKPSASPAGQDANLSAEVFFVNVTEDCSMLAQVIGDLLLTHSIFPHFEHRRELTEGDLLERERSNKQNRATVWILMPHPRAARLVFADPKLQRFLVREIPLPQGLDELGRESIAQVIESSTFALLQGSAGLSRAEVRTALSPYLAESSRLPASLEPWRPSPLPAQSEAYKVSQRALRLRLGVTYGLSLSGSDFGLQQGPGLLSGLEFVRSADSLLVMVAYEWHLERHHRTTEFDLAVQSNFVWLLLGWRKPIRDANFLAILGPGVELARVNPMLSSGSTASVVQHTVHLSPWARMAVGFEWGESPLAVQLLGTIDVSAYRTHYDIERNGRWGELAGSWSIRPGAALAALWR